MRLSKFKRHDLPLPKSICAEEYAFSYSRWWWPPSPAENRPSTPDPKPPTPTHLGLSDGSLYLKIVTFWHAEPWPTRRSCRTDGRIMTVMTDESPFNEPHGVEKSGRMIFPRAWLTEVREHELTLVLTTPTWNRSCCSSRNFPPMRRLLVRLRRWFLLWYSERWSIYSGFIRERESKFI